MSNALKYVSMAVILSAVMAGNVEASKDPKMADESAGGAGMESTDMTILSPADIPGIPADITVLRIQNRLGGWFVRPSMVIEAFPRLQSLREIHNDVWHKVSDESKEAFNNHPTLTKVYGERGILLWEKPMGG